MQFPKANIPTVGISAMLSHFKLGKQKQFYKPTGIKFTNIKSRTVYTGQQFSSYCNIGISNIVNTCQQNIRSKIYNSSFGIKFKCFSFEWRVHIPLKMFWEFFKFNIFSFSLAELTRAPHREVWRGAGSPSLEHTQQKT